MKETDAAYITELDIKMTPEKCSLTLLIPCASQRNIRKCPFFHSGTIYGRRKSLHQIIFIEEWKKGFCLLLISLFHFQDVRFCVRKILKSDFNEAKRFYYISLILWLCENQFEWSFLHFVICEIWPENIRKSRNEKKWQSRDSVDSHVACCTHSESNS